MESMPFRMIASSILIAVILTLGIYETNYFLNINSERQFNQDLLKIKNSMDLLQSSSPGSFSNLQINIPGDSEIVFNNETDQIEAYFSKRNFKINTNRDLVNRLELKTGKHEIRFFYGNPEVIKDNMLVFR